MPLSKAADCAVDDPYHGTVDLQVYDYAAKPIINGVLEALYDEKSAFEDFAEMHLGFVTFLLSTQVEGLQWHSICLWRETKCICSLRDLSFSVSVYLAARPRPDLIRQDTHHGGIELCFMVMLGALKP